MISRRGLITLFRGKPDPSRRAEFSLDTYYSSRAARGEANGGTIPEFVVRDDGITTATSSVGVTREGSGVARVREQDCLAYTSFCSVCSERCPVSGAITVELGRPRVDPMKCDGCGLCVGVCPAPGNGRVMGALELVARSPEDAPAEATVEEREASA